MTAGWYGHSCPRTPSSGEQLGRWPRAQRAGWPGPEEDQRHLLTAIGVEADPEPVAAKAVAEAKPRVSRTDRFAQGPRRWWPSRKECGPSVPISGTGSD
ncbi:hypothetical protein GCM10010505_29450 [Kitasatospora aburaviensis]